MRGRHDESDGAGASDHVSCAGSPDDWPERPYTRLKLEPYTEVIGAEVRGVDLSDPLDDELRDEIRHALLEWKVLFFRDQHLTSAAAAAVRAGVR